MFLDLWARRWGVSPAALRDLRYHFGAVEDHSRPVSADPESEADIQNRVRLEASRCGVRLWRNNVGALKDDRGRFIRYGLCNDSKAMNKKIKSSDLVGIRPVVITPEMVGTTLGQFVAREVKEGAWRFSGSAHETAQLTFLRLVESLGGDAAFTNREGSL